MDAYAGVLVYMMVYDGIWMNTKVMGVYEPMWMYMKIYSGI